MRGGVDYQIKTCEVDKAPQVLAKYNKLCFIIMVFILLTELFRG